MDTTATRNVDIRAFRRVCGTVPTTTATGGRERDETSVIYIIIIYICGYKPEHNNVRVRNNTDSSNNT